MKKIIVLALALILAFSLVSCNTTHAEHFIQNTYPNAEFSLNHYSGEEDDDNPIFKSVSKITDDAILTMFDELFVAVTEYFNVTAEQPPIKWIEHPDKTCGALYYREHKTIYLNKNCKIENIENIETAIVHEIIHYIADGNTTSGIAYLTDVQGQAAIIGLKFNEGLTEYFAQQIRPYNYMKLKLNVYYFEQHIAKALSAIVGEKQLKEIYLNNSYQELKDLFNKHLNMSFGIQQDNIALDAFDFFCMQVDDCFNETNKYAKGLRMNSIVAEIFIIAEGEGKETEVKEIMKEFGKSKYNLPSSYKY